MILAYTCSNNTVMYFIAYRMEVNLYGRDGNTTVVVECVGGGVVPSGSYQLDQVLMQHYYNNI